MNPDGTKDACMIGAGPAGPGASQDAISKKAPTLKRAGLLTFSIAV